jgi:hypothetical protein
MTITLTHPTDSTVTWTSGKRGKRPNWVNAILAADPTLLPKKQSEEDEFVSTVDDNTPRLRYWRWNGLNDEDGKGIPLTLCIVGGMTVQDAMTRLNKTFSTPVMPAEWATCWKEINPENVQLGGKVGVFEKKKGSTDWVERKEKTQ